MVWSHNDSWMVTADQTGYVKYWQSNMNNVKMFQAHKEPVRAIRCDILLITTIQFATASQFTALQLLFTYSNLLANKHPFYQVDSALCDDALPILKNNNTKFNHRSQRSLLLQNKLLLIFSLSIINKERDISQQNCAECFEMVTELY